MLTIKAMVKKDDMRVDRKYNVKLCKELFLRPILSSTYRSLISAVPIHTVCLSLPTKDRTSL